MVRNYLPFMQYGFTWDQYMEMPSKVVAILLMIWKEDLAKGSS